MYAAEVLANRRDLSVAGKRAGLAGERSGLFMEQIRLIKEMRKRDEDDGRTGGDVFPRFMLWENVPGCFSSNGGEDFRAVLEETARVAEPGISIPRYERGGWTNAGAIIGNGWSLAWRTHDSQYWGTPQRRRRVALLADFHGLDAPEILFERVAGRESGSEVRAVVDGLSGDFTEGGTTWEDKEHARDSCESPKKTGGDSAVYGFPLGFRPENVKCYEETSTTICNGTRPGFTSGIVRDINRAGGVLTITRELNVTIEAVGTLTATDYKGAPCLMEVK